jgi:uncharacterized lipoprotein YddW (UPF0748 family)
MARRRSRALRAARRAALALAVFAPAGGAARAQSAAAPPPPPPRDSLDSLAPPPVPREFRGLWVASVANIDWPSKPGLTIWEQQAELIVLLNQAEAMRLNAIILQVRPECDALYASSLEPWSYFLTGAMGRAPDPYYDPLAFAVEEAHRRGLELHAWFNPFRARHPDDVSKATVMHVSREHPEWVKRYGPFQWLDPGEEGARRWSIRVITDVVRRYDIDGVHIDDYFYPYPEKDARGRPIDFPDDRSWKRYRRQGGRLSRADWRRRNVDTFVHDLYIAVRAASPRVRFGVSPFGIWRPGVPAGIDGFDAYAEIYADSRKWLQEGWVDYFTPQLYWPVSDPKHGYAQLLAWWSAQNAHQRHLWPGNYTGRVGARGATGWAAGEVLEQIRVTRDQRGASGNVHFSAEVFRADRDSITERLAEAGGPYAGPALVPPSPWLDARIPGAPAASIGTDTLTNDTVVRLAPAPGETAWLYVVRSRAGSRWTTALVPGTERSWVLALAGADSSAHPDAAVVSAVSRTGIEGPAVTVRPR